MSHPPDWPQLKSLTTASIGRSMEPKERSRTVAPMRAGEAMLENHLLGIRSSACVSWSAITRPLLTFRNDHLMWLDLRDLLKELFHFLTGRHV